MPRNRYRRLAILLILLLAPLAHTSNKTKRNEVGLGFGVIGLTTRDLALSAASYSGSRFKIPLQMFYSLRKRRRYMIFAVSYIDKIKLTSKIDTPAFDNHAEYRLFEGSFHYFKPLTSTKKQRIRFFYGGGLDTQYGLRHQINIRRNQSVANEIVEEFYASLTASFNIQANLNQSGATMLSFALDAPFLTYSLRPPRFVKGSLKSSVSLLDKFQKLNLVWDLRFTLSEHLALRFLFESKYYRLDRIHLTETAITKFAAGWSLNF